MKTSKILLFLLGLVLLLPACTKRDIITPQASNPKAFFYCNYEINGVPYNLEAGAGDLILDCSRVDVPQRSWNSAIEHKNSFGPMIEFTINNHVVVTSDTFFDINNSISNKEYIFLSPFLPSNTPCSVVLTAVYQGLPYMSSLIDNFSERLIIHQIQDTVFNGQLLKIADFTFEATLRSPITGDTIKIKNGSARMAFSNN